MYRLNNRPRAFWGMLASTAIGTVGSLISGAHAKKEARKQQRLQEAKNFAQSETQRANNVNKILSSEQSPYADEEDLVYRCGGRIRPRARFGLGEALQVAAPLVGAGIDYAVGGRSSGNKDANNLSGSNPDDTSVMKNNTVPLQAVPTVSNTVLPQNNTNTDINTLKEEITGQKQTFSKGGKIKITDGGNAIPLGFNNIFLLRGASHEDLHNGKTGIGIKVGGKEIEAESGEAVQPTSDGLRIFSGQPMLNGISPAQAVASGANPTDIFRWQEYIKKANRLNDDGTSYKKGGVVKRPKAELGTWNWYTQRFENNNNDTNITIPYKTNNQLTNVNTNNNNLSVDDYNKYYIPLNGNDNWGLDVTKGDYANLATDLIGSLSANWLNSKALNNIKYKYSIPQFVEEIPVALPTRYYNGAQRAEVERARENQLTNIGRNTASSNTALQRMQSTNTEATEEMNKLWDKKANEETKMRQANLLNEQEVRSRNATARNAYLQKVAEIQKAEQDSNNEIARLKAQARSVSLNGLSKAFSNFFNQARQRYEDNQALTAYLAASDNGTPYRIMSAGTRFTPEQYAAAYNWANQVYANNVNKPNKEAYKKSDGTYDDGAYSAALKDWEAKTLLNKQAMQGRDLAINGLRSTRRGRKYLSRIQPFILN